MSPFELLLCSCLLLASAAGGIEAHDGDHGSDPRLPASCSDLMAVHGCLAVSKAGLCGPLGIACRATCGICK